MFSSVRAEPPMARSASLRTRSFSLNVQALADCQKGLPFALFGALAIADVQRGGVVVAGGESGADAGIHASAEQDYGAGFVGMGHF